MHVPPSQLSQSNDPSVTNTSGQRIIVIGASAGGLEAIKTLVKGLPPDLNASLFIVWHMSSEVRGILPQLLNRVSQLPAQHATDGEKFKPGHVYVAPPDHHLLLEEGRMRLTHGPKENRFRPAIDPLFRSAAWVYGSRVIGIILTGALDDGTAGLWQVKSRGGIAVVQDPHDAEVSSMPASALRQVKVDHCVPVKEMAPLLDRLCKAPVPENPNAMKDEKTKIEIGIAAEMGTLENSSLHIGELSTFTCPECHGVLSRIMDDNFARFRCHTGHAFSPDTLMAAITEKIEDSLYNAIRLIDESVLLLNHMGDHFAEANELKLAAVYFRKAHEATERNSLVRKAAMEHEQLTQDKLLQEVEQPDTEPTQFK